MLLVVAILTVLLQVLFGGLNPEGLAPHQYIKQKTGDIFSWLPLVEAFLETGRWSPFLPLHNAPYGLETHLTRPFAEFVRVLALPVGLFLPPKETALVAGMVSSPILQVVTAVLVAWGASTVLSSMGAMLAAAAFLMNTRSTFSVYQYDHHGLHLCLEAAVIVLLMRHAVGFGRAGWLAAAAGAVAAIGIWAGTEMLLTACAGGLALGLAWVLWGGHRRAQGLWRYTCTLAVVLACSLAVEHSPEDWMSVELDRLSGVHVLLAALLVSSAGSVALAQRFWPHLGGILRGMVATFAVVCAGLSLWAIVPDFFRGPYAAVDALVQESLWGIVGERPAWSLFAATPALAGYYLLPFLLAAACATQGLQGGRGKQREAWLIILIAMATGLLAAFWKARLIRHSLLFIAIPLGGAAALLGLQVWNRMPRELRPAAGFAVLGIILSPYVGLVVGDFAVKADSVDRFWESVSNQEACDWRSLGSAVARMPQLRGGTIVTEPHHGADLAYLSGVGVVATGCHCNGEGLTDALAIFVSAPDAARTLAQRRDVEFIMQCPAARGVHGHDWYIARSGPDGLYARLARGRPPDWLIPVPVSEIGVEGFVIHRTTFTESTRTRVSPVPVE